MIQLFNYIERVSPIHKLTGASKMACMLCWVLAAMITFDTRYLVLLTVFALILFRVSRIKVSDVKVILIFSLVFLAMNNLLIYLFSPEHGVSIYGTRTVLFHIIGRYSITAQQLLYHANMINKQKPDKYKKKV